MNAPKKNANDLTRRANRNFALAAALAAAVFALDQISKRVAVAQLAGAPVEILPFFQFALVFNQGAAFGFLGDAGGWQRFFLIGVAALVSAALPVWMWRARGGGALLVCALALLLGGALGNLADRLLHHHVIDFIVLHYRHWYFPAFNLADSAITIGAGGVILESFIRPRASLRV